MRENIHPFLNCSIYRRELYLLQSHRPAQAKNKWNLYSMRMGGNHSRTLCDGEEKILPVTGFEFLLFKTYE
jgi:hypothetical protein